MNIKILQWNTWFRESLEHKLELINQVKPDIICLQELNILPELNEFEIIKDSLGFFGTLGVADTDHGGQGNAILSRYPIRNDFSVYIKDPVEPRKHFSDEGRVYVQSEINVDGKKITLGTVHMSYVDRFEDNDLKIAESNKLMEIVTNNQDSYILAGDFNTPEKSLNIQKLLETFSNSGPEYDQKTWTTKPFSYNGFTEDKLNWRLDYVFHTPDLEPISSQIIKTDYSDHLPIVVEFNIPESSK